MRAMRWMGWVVVLVLPGVLGACGSRVFPKSDNYTQSRINRYWEGDSAVETREARSRSADTGGFGFPTGMANQ
jgi:hypothetical protein